MGNLWKLLANKLGKTRENLFAFFEVNTFGKAEENMVIEFEIVWE
jgi:hypothetical protein